MMDVPPPAATAKPALTCGEKSNPLFAVLVRGLAQVRSGLFGYSTLVLM